MVERAETKDFKELLKFENKVFKIRFENKVPKIYNHPELAKLHGVYKDNGKIVGAICVYPGSFRLGEESLAVAGIGSVAVSKSMRGKGIMKELMEYAGEESERLGADVGVLSGYRRRYERFGYVPAGVKYVYEVSDHFISRHVPKNDFSFERAESEAALREIEELQKSLPAFHERESEKLSDILKTWHSVPYLVKGKNGETRGYLVFKAQESAVSEFVLKENGEARDVLVLFAREKRLKRVFLWAQHFQKELLSEMLSFGEHFRIECAGSLKIFSFKRVLQKMLSFTLSRSSLQNGTLVLKAGGENLKIEVRGNEAFVTETDEKPEVVLTREQATVFLTRPDGALLENPLLRAWTPLCPFGIFDVDMV